jgi:extracellular factor (EF) 3-hydroxypalmitic acid methyl ester biosynthesis protein
MERLDANNRLVVFQNAQGVKTRAAVVRLTRHQVVFEVSHAPEVLRPSEVLDPFIILIGDQPLYSGTAVLTGLVNTGLMLLCEARLQDNWPQIDPLASRLKASLDVEFQEFLGQWEKLYRMGHEYKIVIADIHSFLVQLQSWLQQIEMGLAKDGSYAALSAQEHAVRQLEQPALGYFTELFQRFEVVAEEVPADRAAVHEAFARRYLHPFVLAAPFAYRTFQKPLGYAGDYEMVNMMARSPYEGESLFAKLFNCWLLQQAPAQAHRNRIAFLADTIRHETARVRASGRRLRALSLGCGPAIELQTLLKEWPASSYIDMVLVDFNEETLAHTRSVLTGLAHTHLATSSFSFVRRSVQQLLKESTKASIGPGGANLDLVYCAGLFDYLSDPICERLMSLLYQWVEPGGVLVCTNVAPHNPFRHCMETFLDWHLAYRSVAQLQRLRPDTIPAEAFSVRADLTGVNNLVEARKN